MTICRPNTSPAPWSPSASWKGDDHGQDERSIKELSCAPPCAQQGQGTSGHLLLGRELAVSPGLIPFLLGPVGRMYFSFTETFYKVSCIYLNSTTATWSGDIQIPLTMGRFITSKHIQGMSINEMI